jgi:hypothetical protein
MNFADENGVDPDDQTHGAKSFPLAQDSPPTTKYLVAVRRKRQLVKIFQPLEKNITFGRSSRCSLTLPDPRLSRKAGEIVLGPVPILRRYSNGEENGDFIPIHPGKSYRFRPYTLTLMEPGDIAFNRQLRERKIRSGSFKRIGLTTCAAAIGILFLLNNIEGQIKLPSTLEENPVATATEKKKVEVELFTAGSEEGLRGEPRQVVPALTSTSLIAQKRTVQSLASEPTTKLPVPSSIPSMELERIIARISGFIEQGDLKTAGRTLLPLMPHLDSEQQKRVIAALDPPVQSLFQKAYMIKPYEPGKSQEILQGIVESGLELLPSYGKARKVLEREMSAVIGNR